MLVVTEAVSIASEKVTEMFSLIETPVWLSVGDMEETVGAVVSFSSSFSFLAQESIRPKANAKIVGKKRNFSSFIEPQYALGT